MRWITGFSCLSVLLAIAPNALAHIDLMVPDNRPGDQKYPPCGDQKSTMRSTTVTTYRPGETITVEWEETIDHPGHFRIAFLQDGQEFSVPGDPASPPPDVLLDGIADMEKGFYKAQVTLPNVTCDNCTLQLMQIMTTEPPPYDPTPGGKGGDFYYQCADLILAGDPVSGGSGGGGAGGNGAGGASGSGGAPNPSGGVAPQAGGGSGGASSGAPATGGAASAPGGGAPAAGGTLASGSGGAPTTTGGVVGPPTGGTAPVTTGGVPPTTGGVLSGGAGGAAAAPAAGGAGAAVDQGGGCNVSPGARSHGLGSLLALGAVLGWARRRRRRAERSTESDRRERAA